MDEKNETLQRQQEFIQQNAEKISMQGDFFNVYTNNVQIGTSRFDLTMLFGKASARGLNYMGEVVMSLEHAKVLSTILADQIKNFEDQFGVINIEGLVDERTTDAK